MKDIRTCLTPLTTFAQSVLFPDGAIGLATQYALAASFALMITFDLLLVRLTPSSAQRPRALGHANWCLCSDVCFLPSFNFALLFSLGLLRSSFFSLSLASDSLFFLFRPPRKCGGEIFVLDHLRCAQDQGPHGVSRFGLVINLQQASNAVLL